MYKPHHICCITVLKMYIYICLYLQLLKRLKKGKKYATIILEEKYLVQKMKGGQIMSDTNTITPIHGVVEISVDPNFTTAFMAMTQPQNGGLDVTLDMVRNAVKEKGITYGLNEDALVDAVEKKRYGENICIARWTPPINGIDGEIKYHFDKDTVIAPVEDETGTVDYKNLGVVKNILTGTTIGTISLPTEGEPGIDITGRTVSQHIGVPAKISIGKGTVITEDGTELIAVTDGNLRYLNGSFIVEEELLIKADVDVATGNIDFIGNVIIKGNVCEGYSVTSKKNITINGTVTSANITCNGDLNIKLGSINSTIDCKGSVKLGFCENSKVTAEGNVEAAAFVGGEVYSGRSIIASGKGAMMGGKYTALENIEANTIGSEGYAKTVITLGNNAVLSEEKDNLEHRNAELDDKFDQLGKILITLQEMAKTAKLPPEREQMKVEAMKSRFQIQGEIKRNKARISEIEQTLERKQTLSVSCRKEFYPGVLIRINSHILQVNVITPHCKATIGDEGIYFAPL